MLAHWQTPIWYLQVHGIVGTASLAAFECHRIQTERVGAGGSYEDFCGRNWFWLVPLYLEDGWTDSSINR
jgi:hypothetical protein